ncbi:MAG: hypothetical protein AAGA85_23205, partial [Bacteroidota bacterium]
MKNTQQRNDRIRTHWRLFLSSYRLILGLTLLSAFSTSAQQGSLFWPDRSECPADLPKVFEFAVDNYCGSCTYKYDNGSGYRTVSLTPVPGGMATFSTIDQLNAGSYEVFENSVSIGSFTISAKTLGNINITPSIAPPWGCAGTPITLTPSGGSSYSWTKNGTPIAGTGPNTV